MEKMKPGVWGEKNGNFTIGGKKPTKKQHQQIADSLKLPDNYIDLIPVIEARLKSIAPRQVEIFPDSPYRDFVRAVSKRVYPEEILRVKGSTKAPPGEEGFSQFEKLMRLVVLQAEWEDIAPQQVIDEALGRLPVGQSTGDENEIPAEKEDTQKDISSKKQNYSWCAEAEQCAKAFKKERDAGSLTNRLDFCIRYAEKRKTSVSGETLDKKLQGHRKRWDPDKKYGRPKSSKG